MKWTNPIVLIDVGGAEGRANGESVHRVRPEDGRDEHARAEGAEEPARRERPRSQHALESHGGGDHHQAAEHEVRRLDPAPRSVGEHAERVTREVEAVPDECLDQADREIERADQHAVAKEGSRHLSPAQYHRREPRRNRRVFSGVRLQLR